MTRISRRRRVTIVVVTAFVACQTALKSSAVATADARTPKAAASKNANATPGSTRQPTPPAKPSAKALNADQNGKKVRTALYGADAKPPKMPHVLMSRADEASCKVKVGDVMPPIELPKLGGPSRVKLSDLFGKKATVVVFWKADRRMSQQQLADLGRDVVEAFGKREVAVVGVAVGDSAKDVETTFSKSGANFPNLFDVDGKAFALGGKDRFPRTYVLDSNEKVVWFDIEYSLATRRELHQALRVLAGGK